jgi:hypothetical protein
LSEARKYGLNLTVANQYVSQMPEVVRDAVFGNVGTMISFRIGPGDATVLGKYYEPVFEAIDMTRLHNQNIFISMIINGEKAAPFSAATLRMPDPENDLTATIMQLTRERYASKRQDVEDDIRARTLGTDEEAARSAGPYGAGPDERKPTKELLGALRNPDLPPLPASAPPARQADRRPDNRGDSRGDSHGERRGASDRNRQGGGERRPEHRDRQQGASAPYRPAQTPQTPQQHPAEPAPAHAGERWGEQQRAAASQAPTPAHQGASTTSHPIQPGEPISFRSQR